ncbi:MAG: MFS transporter [Deinococcus sp.]|nr:MFS transporter [Deinococcus sp.]
MAFALAWTLLGLYYVQDVGLSPLELLLVGAALEAACFLLETPTGVIADVYSRRLSVILGAVFLGLGMLFTALLPSFWGILFAMLVCAVGYTCLSGATQAWLADEVGEAAASTLYLRGSQVSRLGGMAGIPLAAALALWGLNVPVALGGVTLLTLALWLRLRMPEQGFAPLPPEERQHWATLTATFRQGASEIRKSHVLTGLVLASLLFGASGEAFDRLKEFLLVREIGLPHSGHVAALLAGLAFVTHLVGFTVTTALTRRFESVTPRQAAAALHWVLLLSVAGMLAFAYAPSFWLAAFAAIIYGVLSGLYFPLYTAWLNHGLDSRSRATVNSIASQADALGQVSFGPLFGLVGNLTGVRLALLVRLPMLAVMRRIENRTK